MKKILLAIAALPLAAIAQKKPAADPVASFSTAPMSVPDMGKFTLAGEVLNAPENMQVSLVNGQTGVLEQNTNVKAGKFSFTGPVNGAEIKLISLNGNYIPVFVETSTMNFKADLSQPQQVSVSGSKAHAEFIDFSNKTRQYDSYFNGSNAASSVEEVDKMVTAYEDFIEKNPESYVTPLALLRMQQFLGDAPKYRKYYEKLPPKVKASNLGLLLSQTANNSASFVAGTELRDFTQQDQDGKPVSLKSFRGKYVLIDFWASWCGPCRRENPNVVAAYKKFRDKNFTILGVSLDQDRQKWLNAVQQDNLTWTQVSDLKGWQNEVAQKFKIQSIPQNILIDPNGKIVGSNLRGVMLEYRLSKLL